MFDYIEGDDRVTTFPIARPNLFEYYKDATRTYWTVEELALSTDVFDYAHRLSAGEQRFVKHILAFFAASDGLVNINLAERFKKDVNMYDANLFYNYQIMMEDVHAHTYSLLLDAIIPDKHERDELLSAFKTMPIITKMSQWMIDCTASDEPFPVRLLKMACVEGIFFTGCFCAIYWLQQRGLMPALGHSNELIARDEGLHTTFALLLYSMLKIKLDEKEVYSIFKDAVDIAKEFTVDALPIGMPGMNADLMKAYIECCADNLLSLINIAPLYGSKHDFMFMEQINLTNRTNFFDRRVSEYSKPITHNVEKYTILTDF